MKKRSNITGHLRDHILGGLHVGRLRGGDRLASVRHVAQQFGINPRTVAAAYRELQNEGLVELRGRSGVFVVKHELPGEEAAHELARWLAAVVTEGWKRRIPAALLPEHLRRAVSSRKIRCGLIEQIHDGMVAFRHDLEDGFGFEVRDIEPGLVRTRKAAPLDDVDFFATTNFYAPVINAAASTIRKPVVFLTVQPGIEKAIRDKLRAGKLTLIACDARFAERLRVAYDPEHNTEIDLILAHDQQRLAQLDPAEPVFLTRAAREVVGDIPNPLIDPHGPTISVDTAVELAGILVRRNVADV